jgi:hypothetical protein
MKRSEDSNDSQKIEKTKNKKTKNEINRGSVQLALRDV